MFYRRVPIASVTRLDGEYYDPIAISVDSQVRGGPYRNFGDLVQTGYRVVYHGIDDAPVDDCLRFLAPTDINAEGDFAASEIAVRVPKNYAVRYPKGISRPGELLIEVKGKTEKLAVVPSDGAEAEPSVMVSGSLYKATLHSDVDTYFVLAYLKSAPGNILKRRVVSNINISYIGKGDLYNIPIPCPAANAQAYIGNKLRQAELLRTRARKIEEVFRKAVGVPVVCPTNPVRFSRLPAVDIGAELNPGRYDHDRLEVRRTLLAHGAVELASFSRVVTPTAEPTAPSESYLGLDGIHSDSVDLTLDTVAAARVTGVCRRLRQGAAISKLRPYLNKVAYISADIVGALGSTELLCVDSDGIHPAFVYGVLKLDTTTRQLNPVATGATHPRVSSSDVLELIVPMHDDHERLGRSLEMAQQQYAAARLLTATAGLLVEAMIERKITEDELVAAQENPDADRALLGRLSTNGLDVTDADELFPDLERLEKLLREAQQGDDE